MDSKLAVVNAGKIWAFVAASERPWNGSFVLSVEDMVVPSGSLTFNGVPTAVMRFVSVVK